MIQIVFTVLQRFIKLVGSFHLNYFLTMHIWPNVRIQTIVSKFQLLFLRGHKFLLSRKNIKNTVVFFISAFTYFHWKPHPPFIKMQWNRMTTLVINRNILTAVSKNIKQKSTENQPTKKKKIPTTTLLYAIYFFIMNLSRGWNHILHLCTYLLSKLNMINFLLIKL